MLTIEKNSDKLLIFDIESYFDDFILIFKNTDKELKYKFVNSYKCSISGETLYSVVDKHILGAYNGYGYDDYMLSKMLTDNPSPREVNLYNEYLFSLDDWSKMRIRIHKNIKSIDLMQEINVTLGREDKNRRSLFSLKHIAANMGLEVFESGVGFDIKRKLTDEELEGEVEYCSNDVDVAVDVYNTKTRKGYFAAKEAVVNEVISVEWTRWGKNAHWFLMRKTRGQLVAELYGGIKSTPIDWDLKLPKPIIDNWQKNWWKADRPSYELEFADNKLIFGYGGLHSVHKNIQRFTNVYHIDVASEYPTIIENENILGSRTKHYSGLKKERVKIKHTQPQKAEGQKIVLNSTYGKLLETRGRMANRSGGTFVCFKGQEAIYNLAVVLAEYGTICQINTDGIYFKPNSYEEDFENLWRTEIAFWEEDFSMDLDVEFYKLLFQRDVNLYLAVDEDDHIKAKGLLGNFDLDVEEGLVASNHKPYDIPIIYKAVVEKIINNVPIIETVSNPDNDIRYYQTVYQANKSFPFIGYTDENGNEVTEKQKVNRLINVNKGIEVNKYKEREQEIRKVTVTKPAEVYVKSTSKNGYNYTIHGFSEDKNYITLSDGRVIANNAYFTTPSGKTFKTCAEAKAPKALRDVLGITGTKWIIKNITIQESTVSTIVLATDDIEHEFEYEFAAFWQYNSMSDMYTDVIKEKHEYEVVDCKLLPSGKYELSYKVPQGWNKIKITNMSNSVEIINEDVVGKRAGDFDINFGYYYAIAQSFYNKLFKGVK